MKNCTYCSNYRFDPNIGGVCAINNTKTVAVDDCINYSVDKKKVEYERNKLKSASQDDPFLWLDKLKEWVYKKPTIDPFTTYKLPRNRTIEVLILANCLVVGIYGVAFAIWGASSADINRAKLIGGLLIALMSVPAFLFLRRTFLAKHSSNPPLLVFSPMGITINGTQVKWDEYLGFKLENHGEKDQPNYLLTFYATREIPNPVAKVYEMKLSVNQLKKVIELYRMHRQ